MISGGGDQLYDAPQVHLGVIRDEVLYLQSDTPPRKVLFARQEGSRLIPLYTLWNGPDGSLKCIFGSNPTIYIHVDIPANSFISNFSYSATLWTAEPGNPNAHSLLIYPNLCGV